MRISLIGPVFPYRGGIAHFSTLMAKKLVETGHQIQVISFKKQYPAWLYPGESDKDYSPNRQKVDAEYLLKPLNPTTWHKTAKAILKFQPDQVIIPWWVTFWGPAFHHIIKFLKQRGITIIVLIHNTMPHEPRPWDRFLARWTLQCADQFIVMNKNEQTRLRSLIQTTQEITIVPHPIYRLFKPDTESTEEIKSRLSLPNDKPILLFFGFIRPYKGLSVLIDALHILVNNHDEIHLIIAGEFWEPREKYEQQISALNLTPYIHIFDRYIPDDEAAQFFTVSDLFIAPYTGGTQSGALKSALGFGLPSVVTDIITDELVHQLPELCRTIPSNNPEALADAILRQLSVPVLEQKEIQTLFDRSWQTLVDAASIKVPNDHTTQT